MKELIVVIPVYNEQDIISKVIDSWHDCLESLAIDFEIHLYNDGSKDNTLSILEESSKKYSKVVIHDKKNSGHGPTILKGYIDNSNAEWLFQIDSDNEISPIYFADLWKERDNFDFLAGQRNYQNRHLARRIISKVAQASVQIFFGKGLRDVNVPYRLMRVSGFSDHFKKIPEDTFAPNVLVSGIAIRHGLRIMTIPVDFISRQTGEVSIKKFKLLKSVLRSFYQTARFAL